MKKILFTITILGFSTLFAAQSQQLANESADHVTPARTSTGRDCTPGSAIHERAKRKGPNDESPQDKSDDADKEDE